VGYALTFKSAETKNVPFPQVPKQLGSVEKQGRKAPLAGVYSFLPSVAPKGSSEKKPTAEEIRRQREEKLKEKQAAEGERLKEKEEAKKRQIEEKRREREEKVRRAEERRREEERAKVEKAKAVEKQRQLQLAGEIGHRNVYSL
jgi:hypothetical protein